MKRVTTWEVLSRSDIETATPTGWMADAYYRFKAQMESRKPGFPCVFGLRGWCRDDIRFLFGDDRDTSAAKLGVALTQYLSAAREIGPYTSLVVMYPPEKRHRSAVEYANRFWSTLQLLHDHDEEPWPEDIPMDTSHPKWDFCFAGEPLFVPATLPCYQLRRSRGSISFGMMFQPRWVFDALIEEPIKLARARAVVRDRAAVYDGVPVHPAIGVYGDTANVEWKQYVLPDDNETVLNRCPLHINGASPTEGLERLTFVSVDSEP